MATFSTIVGAMAAIAWTVLLLFRGRFWQVSGVLPGDSSSGAVPVVAAVVPARDEAKTVGEAVVSLLQQRSVNMKVFLVDDDSSDGTAEVARRAVQQAGLSKLNLVRPEPLPDGWTGKLWAMRQGVYAADQYSPEWLLLTDADIVHGPNVVAQLTAIAQAGNYDLVSFMVKLHCKSLAEKLLCPAFVFFFFMLYPPLWVADPGKKIAGAAGGCLLIRRETLVRIGGIESIRSEVIDDCALARAVKQSGARVRLGLTHDSLSVRQYPTFSSMWNLIARTAFRQLNHSTLLLLATILAMAVVYLAPPLLLLSLARISIALGAAAWLAMTVAYLPIIRFYGLNPLWALTLPLTALFYLGATVWSAIQYWLGRGGQWKGRVQDRAQSA